MHMFSRNWNKPNVAMQFPDKKGMSLEQGYLQAKKIFFLLKQAVSRL